MTATDELRRLLDERGVEWETDRSGFRVMWGRPVDEFHDTMQFKAVDNALPNGGLNVHICGATPEQAIEATLGRGECTLEKVCDGYLYFRAYECSECGTRFAYRAIRSAEYDPPKYCPHCGCKVVDE